MQSESYKLLCVYQYMNTKAKSMLFNRIQRCSKVQITASELHKRIPSLQLNTLLKCIANFDSFSLNFTIFQIVVTEK